MVADLNVGKKLWRCACNWVVGPRPGSTELNNACPKCYASVNKKKGLCDERGKPFTKAGQQITDEPVGKKKAKNKARAARRKKHKTESSEEEWDALTAEFDTYRDTQENDSQTERPDWREGWGDI